MKFRQKSGTLKLIPLGGVSDVTKNMYVYEQGDEIIIIDCGIGFPDETMPGVDALLPDITYLLDKKQKIKGIIITHGHEDHIGGLPFILPQLNFPPIYGTKLSIGLIKAKLEEHQLLEQTKLNTIHPDQYLNLGNFKFEFFRVCHSIPDAVGIIIHTPIGIFVHAADFKFDWTPVSGHKTEVSKIAQIGRKGVFCLLSDCLRIEKEGYTLSEKFISQTFRENMRNVKGKVWITTFSSNISRIQQAIDVSQELGRKIAFVGRSMEQYSEVAQKLGYLNFSQQQIIDAKKIKRFPDNKLTILVAGSQAQAGSALTRIVNKEHKHFQIERGDKVIFASDPIPGNIDAVYHLIDHIYELGAEAVYSDIQDQLHVSGHAAKEELKLMLSLTKPRFVIPMGGTYRHLQLYRQMAQEMGMSKRRILTADNGSVIEFDRQKARITASLALRNIMIDGLGIGDVGSVVLRDRKRLADDGILIIVGIYDEANRALQGEVDIISRGFVYAKETPELIEDLRKLIKKTLSQHKSKKTDWPFLRKHVEDTIREFIYKKTKRRPMILALILQA